MLSTSLIEKRAISTVIIKSNVGGERVISRGAPEISVLAPMVPFYVHYDVSKWF